MEQANENIHFMKFKLGHFQSVGKRLFFAKPPFKLNGLDTTDLRMRSTCQEHIYDVV